MTLRSKVSDSLKFALLSKTEVTCRFPEWGHSYNALYVPLRRWSWQCALMPAGEVKERSFKGSSSFDECEKKRREQKNQIEEDKEDFCRLFRVDIDPRDAGSSFEFKHYADFIRDTLRASSGDVRDGEGITRALRNAVRNGLIIPVINRSWQGGQRVFKHYAPLHWPRDGGGVSFARSPGEANASTGRFTGPFAAAMHAADTVMNSRLVGKSRVFSSTRVGSGDGGFDWLDAAESVARAVFGGENSTDDSGSDSMLKNFGDSDDDGSFLDNAQPFEYQPDMPDGEAIEVAGSQGTPRNNQAQNKQTDDIARTLRLTPGQARQLHDEISGEGLGYHEIMERAKDMFNLW